MSSGYLARGGLRHDISITNRRDRLQRPPDRQSQEGKSSGSTIRITTAPTNASATNVRERPMTADRALTIRRTRRSMVEALLVWVVFGRLPSRNLLGARSCAQAMLRVRRDTTSRPTSARRVRSPHPPPPAATAPYVNAGNATCARCHEPIHAGEEWHLDHNDTRDGYLGVSHAYCNLRDGCQQDQRTPPARRSSSSGPTAGRNAGTTTRPSARSTTTAARNPEIYVGNGDWQPLDETRPTKHSDTGVSEVRTLRDARRTSCERVRAPKGPHVETAEPVGATSSRRRPRPSWSRR